MINKYISLLIILTLLLSTNYAFSQTHPEHEIIIEESKGGYFELVTSIINSHSFNEDEVNTANELHALYWFNHRLGGGLSLTSKLHEGELLYDTAIIGSWSIAKWLTFNVGTNFSWAGEHRDFGVSLYAELEFNIYIIDQIHVGPVIGMLGGSEDEFTHGFHIGFEF